MDGRLHLSSCRPSLGSALASLARRLVRRKRVVLTDRPALIPSSWDDAEEWESPGDHSSAVRSTLAYEERSTRGGFSIHVGRECGGREHRAR
jgi:hypothetical protein